MDLTSFVAGLAAGQMQGTTQGTTALNIAYGDTAPADTSKLWVKTSAPTTVEIADRVAHSGETLDIGVADFYTGVTAFSVAVVDNKVYTFGGQEGPPSSVITDHYANSYYIFDPETLRSDSVRDFSDGVDGIACAAVGDKIYLFGGETFDGKLMNSINIYIPSSKLYTSTLKYLPVYGRDFSAAAVGDKIYIFGGQIASSATGTTSRGRRIYIYDTVTNVLTELAHRISSERSHVGTVAVGTKIYLFGGRLSSGYYSGIEVYDTTKEDLGNALTSLDVSLPMTGIVTPVLLGKDVYFCNDTTVYKFDTETETFSTIDAIDLPYNCSASGLAAVGGKIYIIGGYDNGLRSGIHVLSTNSPLTAGTLLIETCIHGKKADLVNTNGTTLNLGIKNVYIGNSEGYAEKVPAYLYRDGAWVEV